MEVTLISTSDEMLSMWKTLLVFVFLLSAGIATHWTSTTTVNADGTFTLENVPVGPVCIGVETEIGSPSLRWLDRPVTVVSPLAEDEPVVIGKGGTTVTGRVKHPPGKLLITLLPLDDPHAFPPHAVPDEFGNFSITSVPPGNYQLVVRKHLSTNTVSQHQQRIEVGAETLELGEIMLSSDFDQIEVYEQVEYPDPLPERIRLAAQEICSRPVEKIWIGELWHPGGAWGAKVHFEPEQTGDTTAVRRIWSVNVPGKSIRKFYSRHNLRGYGWRFSDEPLPEGNLREENVRIFPLASHTLHLEIDEPLQYETAMSLLKAIEAKSWQHPAPPQANRNGWASGIAKGSGGRITPEDIPNIRAIRMEGPGGEIQVDTRTSHTSGRTFSFRQEGDTFILSGASAWRS